MAKRKPIGKPLEHHTDGIWHLAFSPNGERLASGGKDRTLILWDLKTRQPAVAQLANHTKQIRSITFSPNGETLATGSEDQTIILWDTSTLQPVGQLIGHTD